MRPETEAPATTAPLLEVRNVKTHFALRGTFAGRVLGRDAGSVKAVDGVSFALQPGEVLGLVGESGSGKTTLARTILGLAEATEGSIRFGGEEVVGMSERDLRRHRRRAQMVFQDPHASLNPAMDLLTAIGHPLKIHGIAHDEGALRRAVGDALEHVGLTPVERYLHAFPSDLSGGQKQRAVIARAIITDPDLLIADEPVSMLDMSVRAKILELMIRLKEELNLTYLYVTHDLATARYFCDRIAIMYLGRIVEIGPTASIFADPKHPYTRSLLRAVPDPDPDRRVPRDLPRGEVPDAVEPPLGCSFHPRCPRAFEPCGWEARDLRDLIERRWAGLGEEAFERERRRIGALDRLDAPSTDATISAGRGSGGGDVRDLLDAIRDRDPDEPLWRGVERVETGSGGVDVTFRPHVDPALLDVGDRRVACHLYDPSLAPPSGEPAA
ncbi:MAG TPA: ABC transporter ATP-binding protein [Actinomycetota bacterium]|nr:ABC transporter ATP-binding protein [Actinomycetota bacterium]